MKKLSFIITLFTLNIFFPNIVQAESFTNYTALAGETQRSPNVKIRKNCKHYYCGPISTINISMDSILEEDLHNYNAGDNNSFEQMIGKGEEVDKYAPAAVMKEMIEAQRRAENGTKITIKIPLIDYGYSGTFNNVLIKVSSKGEAYKSTIQDLVGGEVTELTGTVNIETYSPFVLKGSYTASLKQYKAIDPRELKCPAFSDPSTPPCIKFTLEGTGSIDGEFNIVSPWKDDDRINDSLDINSSFVDPIKNDIKGMLVQYQIDIDVDKEFEKIEGNRRQSKGSRSSGGSVYGDCNCSCNFSSSATEKCKTSCRRVFEACNGVRYSPVKRKIVNIDKTNVISTLPKVPGGKLFGVDQALVDSLEQGTAEIPSNLRDKYIATLKTKLPGPENMPMRDMMLKGFDEMPDDKSKMFMLMSIEGM